MRSLTLAIAIALMVLGLLSIPLLAEDNSANIRTAVDAWETMWNTFDYREVDRLFLQSDDLSYFSSEREGMIRGIQAVREHHRGFGFTEGGSANLTRLWLDAVEIRDYRSSAVVTGIWYFQRTDGVLQKGPVSMVYVKGDGGYKIAHMNFSNYPSETLPDNFQAISLLGDILTSDKPSPDSLGKYGAAKRKFEGAPRILENIIWYGRRTAYTGDFRRAIQIYSEGLELFPDEPRLYRHRGHRLISVREYGDAISDFEKALGLIRGTTDQIEPDGLPNAMNIPVSSLHSNIRYHLGLTYYLTGQLEKAVEIYREDLTAALNDDQIVSTTHWLYMVLRRLGRHDEARKVLDGVSEEMTVIENHAYHRLCLFYKGTLGVDDLQSGGSEGPASAATLYGIANWYSYNGEQEKADEMLQRIVDGPGWPAFGYAGAEADLAKNVR